MVHSADSRIQSHTFGCPLLSPDVSDHASTNPASSAQENCALIANQNVRGIRDNLRRTAHGCVLLSSNTHQVTKTENAPAYHAQSWRRFALCATSGFRLTTVRLQTSVGRASARSCC